jgi:hypothetical protein
MLRNCQVCHVTMECETNTELLRFNTMHEACKHAQQVTAAHHELDQAGFTIEQIQALIATFSIRS